MAITLDCGLIDPSCKPRLRTANDQSYVRARVCVFNVVCVLLQTMEIAKQRVDTLFSQTGVHSEAAACTSN